MPKLKTRAPQALSPSAAGLSRRSDVVGIHLLKVSGEWVSVSDEIASTSPPLLSSNRSPLETSPSTFYGRGKHCTSTASKPRRKVLDNRRQTLPSSTASKPRRVVLGDRKQSLPHTVDRMPVPLLKCKSEKLISRAKRVKRRLPPLSEVVADRFTQQSIRSWLSIRSKPILPLESDKVYDFCADENKPEQATVMGQKVVLPVPNDGSAGVKTPAPESDRFLPKAASSPLVAGNNSVSNSNTANNENVSSCKDTSLDEVVDNSDLKRTLHSKSRKRIIFESVAADLPPRDADASPVNENIPIDKALQTRPESELADTCDSVEVNMKDADVTAETAVLSPTQFNNSGAIHPGVKLEASQGDDMQDSVCEGQQTVNVSESARGLTKASSIIHKSLGVRPDDTSCPGSPSRVSVGTLLVNEEISFGGSARFNINRHVMDLGSPCDTDATETDTASGNAARPTGQHSTSDNRHVMDLGPPCDNDATETDTASGNAARSSGQHSRDNRPRPYRPRTVCKRKARVRTEVENEVETEQQGDEMNLVYEQNLYQDLEGVPMVVLQKMSKVVLLKYYKIVVDH